MGGYAGKILRVNLTTGTIGQIATSQYESYVGGHGIGSAIFFDLVPNKAIPYDHPNNVITVMTSPISGTLVPCGAGRTEVQCIGAQSYPVEWFTRSNFGGRFSSQLKYAGWDGIVVEGASSTPAWLDIRDGEVALRPCAELNLWGMDTRQCQQTIWNDVAEGEPYGDWKKPTGASGGQTTQRPAVLTIGPAGENRCRVACLIHDAGNACGQGGFGAVFGVKMLKAISVIGTGSVNVGDPKGLVEARLWHRDTYAFDYDNLLSDQGIGDGNPNGMSDPPSPILRWGSFTGGRPKDGQRPQSCVGCYAGCRARFKSGVGNEASCLATAFYSEAKTLGIQYQVTDLLNLYGLNAIEMTRGLHYLRVLHSMGVLGPGLVIDCPIDFNQIGSLAFAEQLLEAISTRSDGLGQPHPFGDTLAEGFVRAAVKWGRYDEDVQHGSRFPFPYWGCPEHGYDPRTEVEWGYGSIFGSRDVNEHEFNNIMWNASLSLGAIPFGNLDGPAEEVVTIYTDKMEPYDGPPEDRKKMLDYGTDNIYSIHIARLVSWHRHFSRFWKQSMLLCDMRWPDFINHYAEGKKGSACVAEPIFLSAVLGRQVTFLEGMALGKTIWNLDNAIWTLQGRTREMVRFADYIYNEDAPFGEWLPNVHLPALVDGKWEYVDTVGRRLDEEKFEQFKTLYYDLEGWDAKTGWPTRQTLTSLGLGKVADELEAVGRLGDE